MSAAFSIAGRDIGVGQSSFIIAEMSGNHGQCLKTARQMLRAAAEAGVDAVKLQTYTADTITLDSQAEEFQISDLGSLWCGENLYSLYQRAHTPWGWHSELFSLAAELGLIIFSSPFDESSVDFLESLAAPCYKIASFEINHFPLLKAVAETGKPVIMSTGMSTADEISEAVAQLRRHGCEQLALLKCTSAYPAAVDEANLATMADMRERFGCVVGLSDHSRGIGVATAAAAMGASIIERHFILSADSDAVDAGFSSTVDEMAQLCEQAELIHAATGTVHYGPSVGEIDSLKYRRSIYLVRDKCAGKSIEHDDIKVVRPGLGMHPKYYDSVIGRRLRVDKQMNTPLLEDELFDD